MHMSAMTSEKTAPWIPADTFGMRLRRVRAELNKNGIEFAALCGLDRGQLSAWENGTMPRNVAAIAQTVADATGVDREWLAFGDAPVNGCQLPFYRAVTDAEYDLSPDLVERHGDAVVFDLRVPLSA
jgi:transcriptional regulator with XRE-family HTH domain